MEANYPARTTATIGGVTYSFNHAANSVTPSNTRPSRFQVYKWEHEVGALTQGNPDRRVMPVAVLNCQAGLSGSHIPVQSFAKVFLTEPMGEGTEDVIWGELAGVLRPGADVQARDQVDVRR
jgi:hypothetical protein